MKYNSNIHSPSHILITNKRVILKPTHSFFYSKTEYNKHSYPMHPNFYITSIKRATHALLGTSLTLSLSGATKEKVTIFPPLHQLKEASILLKKLKK